MLAFFTSGSYVAIASSVFFNAYLRIDGTDCNATSNNGCGVVNAQYYNNGSYPVTNPVTFEYLQLHQNSDGSWCIGSWYFPHNTVRGQFPNCTNLSDPNEGCGKVNLQYESTTGTDCTSDRPFTINYYGNNRWSFQSVKFPNSYLRMNATMCTAFESPGCPVTVNGRWFPTGSGPGPTDWEMFNIMYMGLPASPVIQQNLVLSEKSALSPGTTVAIVVPIVLFALLAAASVYWFFVKPRFSPYSFSDPNEETSTNEVELEQEQTKENSESDSQ